MDQFSQYRENSDDSDNSDNNSFINEGVAEYKIVLNGETLSDEEEDSLLPPIEEDEEEVPTPRVASDSRFNSIGSRMLTLIRLRDIGKDIDFEAIQAETGVSRSSVYKLKKKAIKRGLN